MTTDAGLLDAALNYAARSWAVFPLEPGGKRPLGRLARHGLTEASCDAAKVSAWWGACPEANIGVVTGRLFEVLDIDSESARSELSALQTETGGEPPDGPTVKTPRGWHVYLASSGHRNTVKLGGIEGLDWRGEGGYVVAPPSVRDDGVRWSWEKPHAQLHKAPDWLLQLLDPASKAAAEATRTNGTRRPDVLAGMTAYGKRAFDGELAELATAGEGTRNHRLNRAAFAIGQLVAGGEIHDVLAVTELLRLTAVRTGLPETEVLRTIRSGLSAGASTPRSAPPQRNDRDKHRRRPR